MRANLFYFYDALCGWCYGFSPVIQQLHESYSDKIDFRVVSGGMVTGERAGPIGKVASYIRTAYKEVERRTGVEFGEAFLKRLEEGSTEFTSVPPAIAMAVFRSYQSAQTIPFSGALQRAVYYDGLPPADIDAYAPLAEQYGLDGAEFVAKMREPYFQKTARQEFEETAAIGIGGFPTLVLHYRDKNYILARGYTPYQPLSEVFDKVVAGEALTS